MEKILCLIPARSGSKGIPHKNIKDFKGKPLIAHSILQAINCKYRDQIRIIVSTDSQEYANIANRWGAETPFLRPKQISQDLSIDYEFIKHSLDWLSENENYKPDIILQLRPTYPTRSIELLNHCLDKFIENYNIFDSLRTVVPTSKTAYKMYRIIDSELIPLFREVDGINEPYNRCRQDLPTTYLHNGCIDIFKAEIIQKDTISGDRILPYVMSENEIHDIDTLEDWKNAEKC
jgi:CMP-N-acetylneuraminic acid synthetase